MEYREIIQNILTKQETITQCHYTLEKLEANNAPTSELLHVSRFLALEKVDLINYANATETVKEIVNELNTIAILSDNEDTTISLQVSGIIDSVLQKLSKQELKIYIYRYFFFSSIDGIGKLCNCSTNHVTKTLAYINATLKAEIIKANVTCCTKTLLKSFADIDEENLSIALSNINKEYESSDDNTGKKTASKKTSKSRNIPWNKLTNFAFVIILIISILANIYLAKNGFNSANSSSDNNEQTQIKQNNEYEGLITNIKGTETVNINKLLSYTTNEDISDSEFFYESEHFIGFYYALPLKSSVPLADCTGAELEEYRQDNKKYYTLKGLNGLQYVIKKSYDTYYLLVLSHISPNNNLEEPLTNVAYLEIWRDFYGSAYSDQIEKITVQHGSTNLNFNDTNVKKLIDMFYFADTAEVLLSTESLAENFLRGTWKRDGYYFIIDVGVIGYNLPEVYSGRAFHSIEDGEYILTPINDESKTYRQFHITALAPNCIQVFCYKNNQTYTLYKQ